jgi:hypothetical protein
MKKALILVLLGFVIGYLVHSKSAAASPQGKAAKSSVEIQSAANFFSDLGKSRWHASAPWFDKVDWVDKRCRTWAQDGDIDVDQTCLVVRNVSGSVSIFPNQYGDRWLEEIKTEMTKPEATKDKWIKRFLEVRGW